MALTDKTFIVFSNTGRRKKVLVSWLLSESAKFAYQAAEFIIQDPQIGDKIEGETFMGRPVKPQLLMRYPYLKTLLDKPVEDEVDIMLLNNEVIEDAPTALEEILDEEVKPLESLSVEELKAICDEREIEYDGRKRKPEYFIELINGN
jgi:hypothetical protein